MVERQPPWRTVWETVGTPRLLVIGGYRMGFVGRRAPVPRIRGSSSLGARAWGSEDLESSARLLGARPLANRRHSTRDLPSLPDAGVVRFMALRPWRWVRLLGAPTPFLLGREERQSARARADCLIRGASSRRILSVRTICASCASSAPWAVEPARAEARIAHPGVAADRILRMQLDPDDRDLALPRPRRSRTSGPPPARCSGGSSPTRGARTASRAS